MTKPLSQVRVLDLTNVLSGPFCCSQLAHLGAEVIKIEMPKTGDLARKLGADPERNDQGMGVSFLAQNAGKKSVTLNLKSDAGKKVLKKIVQSSDVLVENFRPGVMKRLGLGYEVLKDVNPQLVYCAISGFGQEGPLANQPAYDQIIQGYSGVMSITGAPENAPYRVGFPIADTIGGLTAAMAISAALAAPKETRGTFIDISMLSATMATMGWVISNALIAGIDPQPRGNDNFTASPSGAFQTKDGKMNIAANKQEQFETLCIEIGAGALITDPRFMDREARLKNRKLLSDLLEGYLAAKTSAEWIEQMAVKGVPVGPVLSVPDILNHAHLQQSGLIQTHKLQDEDIAVVGSAIRLDDEALNVSSPPPDLGQNTNDILAEIGYSLSEIDAFKSEGVI